MRKIAMSRLGGALVFALLMGSAPLPALAQEVAAGPESEAQAEEGTSPDMEIPAVETESVSDQEISSRPFEELMQQVLDDLDSSTPSVVSMGSRALEQGAGTIQEFSGANRIEVSSLVAQAAYPDGCSTAVIAGSDGWADALGSTSLAGLLDCPILLTDAGHLSAGTLITLKELGVTSVVIVGGPNTVSTAVESELVASGVSVAARLGGENRHEVQTSIFNYGKGRWSTDYVIVASGTAFADALSSSPLAFSQKAPIFLVDGSGALDASQKSLLSEYVSANKEMKIVVVGGERSVSASTYSYLSTLSSDILRIGGADRYEASANFATWATGQGLLSWDGAAFTTGEKPYDALTGSALQGKNGSVMLLLSSGTSPTVTKFISSSPTSVKFFGGTASIPAAWRTSIISQMYSVSAYDTGISLSRMADLEDAAHGANRNEILAYLDPSNFAYGSYGYLQFADLSQGYSGRVSAQQIDNFIQSMCSQYGYSNSTLLGMGSTIVDAARTYNVNEVYLLAHAILESGWGTSALAQGSVKGYEGYYNFFGIGAYDKDPNNGGAYLAKSRGWDTPEKGIRGAAEWISSNYINSGTYHQNTLYKMRWNTSVTWHQYATDLKWANSIARVMDQAYAYFGLSFSDRGLTFLYPVYR